MYLKAVWDSLIQTQAPRRFNFLDRYHVEIFRGILIMGITFSLQICLCAQEIARFLPGPCPRKAPMTKRRVDMWLKSRRPTKNSRGCGGLGPGSSNTQQGMVLNAFLSHFLD